MAVQIHISYLSSVKSMCGVGEKGIYMHIYDMDVLLYMHYYVYTHITCKYVSEYLHIYG